MTQEEKETQIKSATVNKTIETVNYYLLNRPGYFYPDQPEQLVDTAIEFVFSDSTRFSFGMNFNYVAIDAFSEQFENVIKNYHESIPVVRMEVNNDQQWANYIGKTIASTNTVYNWFEDVDEVRHFIPQDIEISFTDGSYLILCATGYFIDDDGISIGDPDSEGEVLVLFNEEDAKFFKRGKYYIGTEISE